MTQNEELAIGAIENGRELMRRLENFYSFECDGGPLANCTEWQELRLCFEHLAMNALNLRINLDEVTASKATAVAALRASFGHLMNAAIDLETGAKKKTALDTINGGVKMVQDALAEIDCQGKGDGK
jgi:hypothetical protein